MKTITDPFFGQSVARNRTFLVNTPYTILTHKSRIFVCRASSVIENKIDFYMEENDSSVIYLDITSSTQEKAETVKSYHESLHAKIAHDVHRMIIDLKASTDSDDRLLVRLNVDRLFTAFNIRKLFNQQQFLRFQVRQTFERFVIQGQFIDTKYNVRSTFNPTH